ncbi:uncharacterized protein BDW43DRAFT_304420 [Aspergillus alliaceus]|uniref:uncharacterized protein n=1 Tax=Petromyces alliaceus TaxID=209559 RepID=UPI0012A45920|nr:uncharacterized protein BDW43DRAFT_304420 [Aspergillus alliaceus]KAB8227675.1 hypothetical protein BDW43DRAFT_304420 [Aspergillus alliaceus]
MDAQDSGKGCQKRSLRTNIQDPFSRKSINCHTIDLDVGHSRHEQPPVAAVRTYMACAQHFIDEVQYSSYVQSLAALINIRLPFQHSPDRLVSVSESMSPRVARTTKTFPYIPLRSYIRQFIVTGNDTTPGLGCVWKQERPNYLLTAKSGRWRATKFAYDILPDEQIPFLRPLRGPAQGQNRLDEILNGAL